MGDLVAIAKALGDPARMRAVVALRAGELCVCQLIELLELAPATVSRHMTILHAAGLVARRKEGRWHYYRLVGREGGAAARAALRWVSESVKDDPIAAREAGRACCVRETDPKELTGCYGG